MFRPLLWSYDFERIDVIRHQKTLIVQAINYGTLAHWRWLRETYGRERVREVLETVPAAALRPPARRLAALMFGVEHFNYAPRGVNSRGI
jgi:hypothetical protein